MKPENVKSIGSTEAHYIGSELEVFANAKNWKAYFARALRPYISGAVAEPGAGIGTTAAALNHPGASSWLCIEPDPVLAAKINENSAATGWQVHVGMLKDIEAGGRFDTILYIDVLEHIEHDRDELEIAAQRLRPGGRVIVLSPAHQALFTPFDAAIGHYRRYDRKSLLALTPAALKVERCFYLDSVGLAATLANKLLLRSAHPSKTQILTWDRLMVPLSTAIDPLIGRSLGKTIVAIWRRDAAR